MGVTDFRLKCATQWAKPPGSLKRKTTGLTDSLPKSVTLVVNFIRGL
jgi:hypothetical protein